MKKKFIYILVGLTVLLLIANLIINWSSKKDPVQVNPEMRTEVIDSLFKQSLSKFNLDSNWVRVVAINSRQYDSLNYVYKVQLPGDLRPTVVLQELNNDFNSFPVQLISDEKIVNGYTTLNVLSKDNLKLQATFYVEDELVRPHSQFAFVLQNFEKLSEDDKKSLLHSILPFSILITPSTQSDSLLRQISEYKKTYSVFIDDGIETQNYALETGFTKTRLKEAVRYIVWNYPQAELFIINEKSNLFSSAIFNFIRDEFISRDVTLSTSNNYITLPPKLEEARSLINFYIESNVDKKGKIILLPANIFLQLKSELLDAKQSGTKYFSPQELINENLRMDESSN